MDKRVGGLVHSTIFQLPSKMGKGILVTPTVHGNLLTGPTAEDIPDKEGVNTTADGLEKVLTLAAKEYSGTSHQTGDHLLCRAAGPLRGRKWGRGFCHRPDERSRWLL